MEEKGCCYPREEHSWMKVVRPSGYNGGLKVGLEVEVDVEGSLGSLLCSLWIGNYLIMNKWMFVHYE